MKLATTIHADGCEASHNNRQATTAAHVISGSTGLVTQRHQPDDCTTNLLGIGGSVALVYWSEGQRFKPHHDEAVTVEQDSLLTRSVCTDASSLCLSSSIHELIELRHPSHPECAANYVLLDFHPLGWKFFCCATWEPWCHGCVICIVYNILSFSSALQPFICSFIHLQ